MLRYRLEGEADLQEEIYETRNVERAKERALLSYDEVEYLKNTKVGNKKQSKTTSGSQGRDVHSQRTAKSVQVVDELVTKMLMLEICKTRFGNSVDLFIEELDSGFEAPPVKTCADAEKSASTLLNMMKSTRLQIGVQ